MKSLLLLFAIMLSYTSNAQLLGSATTKMQGGVMGKVCSLTPQIGFYESGTNIMEETIIFNNINISNNQETVTYVITQKDGGEGFQAFAKFLSSETSANLRIGHRINKINNHISKTSLDWFGTNLVGKEIGKIELIINKVEFATPGVNRTGDGNWTDFIYEFTINIYGSEELVVHN